MRETRPRTGKEKHAARGRIMLEPERMKTVKTKGDAGRKIKGRKAQVGPNKKST